MGGRTWEPSSEASRVAPFDTRIEEAFDGPVRAAVGHSCSPMCMILDLVGENR